VDDVVEYNCRALTAELEESVLLNVGTGERRTIFDLINAIGKALGVEPRYTVTGDFRLGDIRHAVADTTQLVKTLGRIDFKPMESGVREFTSWVVEQKLPQATNSAFRKSLKEMRAAGMLRTAGRS